MDYELDWPADTAFRAMNEAHQDSLTEEIQNIQQIGKDYDRKMQTMTLTDLLLDVNTDEDRRMNAGFYVKYFSRAGKLNDFSGAYSVSEWYRRNLYMYSNLQKLISSKDERILVRMY